jgi:membrane fusion protein, multidrug efflux system
MPSMKFCTRFPILMAVVMALGLAACDRTPPAAGPAAGPPPVSVAAAIAREVVLSDEFPGRFEAVDAVAIRARVNGYLQSVHFVPGTEVAKDTLLFQIDPRPFQTRLAEARAALATTEADLRLARIEKVRQARMLETRATSQREFDAASSRLQSLDAQRSANMAAITRAELDLAYTRITAPIAGRVGKDELTAGNLVQGEAPDSPVLTTLVSVDPVRVAFEADEQAYLRYIAAARGKPLQVGVGLANEPGFPHAATLEFVDNQVALSTGTVRMRAVLPNPERRFTPGLFARVRLQADTAAERCVLVSERALGTDQSKRYVLVVGGDNVANYREVQVGRQVGALRVITAGLKEGETIIVNGLQRVRPGSPVTPEVVPMEAAAPAPAP